MPGENRVSPDLEGGREKRVKEEETIDVGISTTMVGWIQRGIGREQGHARIRV